MKDGVLSSRGKEKEQKTFPKLSTGDAALVSTTRACVHGVWPHTAQGEDAGETHAGHTGRGDQRDPRGLSLPGCASGLAPVVSFGMKVLGTITDAHERELLAGEDLWPEVPHQVCPPPLPVSTEHLPPGCPSTGERLTHCSSGDNAPGASHRRIASVPFG
jgi:hypothetical protein